VDAEGVMSKYKTGSFAAYRSEGKRCIACSVTARFAGARRATSLLPLTRSFESGDYATRERSDVSGMVLLGLTFAGNAGYRTSHCKKGAIAPIDRRPVFPITIAN